MASLKCSRVFAELKRESDCGKRYITMEGSSRSTKTYSILQYSILRCMQASLPIKVAIIRSRLTWLRATVIPDFREIMRDQFGIWDETLFNKSEMEYRFPNRSIIKFIGLDSDAGRQKAHGFKSDVLFFNEATELEYEPVRQLMMRCVGGPIIFDLNPNCGDDFWLFSKVMTRPRSVFIHSTYKDNPFLTQDVVDEIETLEPTPKNIANGTADHTLWKIYGLGERAILKGLVYPEFGLCNSMPEQFTMRAFGLDFGFSNDETALLLCAKFDGVIYCDEWLYKKNLTSIINPHNLDQPSMESEFIKLGVWKQTPIWADNARPEVIRDLANCGYNIRAVTKGRDSILTGVNTVKRDKLVVTEHSSNLIKELRNYKWREGQDGEPTTIPIDKYNHLMDALRYCVTMQFTDYNFKSARYDTSKPKETGIEKYEY